MASPQEQPDSSSDSPICVWENEQFTRRRLAAQQRAMTIDLRTPPQSPSTTPDSTITPPRNAYALRRRNNSNNDGDYSPPAPKKTRDPYSCPICLDDVIGREPMTTKCGHLYCKECIVRAIDSSRKCPLCKTKLTVRNIMRVYI